MHEGECVPECDGYAHSNKCEWTSTQAFIEKLIRDRDALQAELSETTRLYMVLQQMNKENCEMADQQRLVSDRLKDLLGRVIPFIDEYSATGQELQKISRAILAKQESIQETAHKLVVEEALSQFADMKEQRDALAEALKISLDAMQKNIAYSAFKDERVLANAIPIAIDALAKLEE